MPDEPSKPVDFSVIDRAPVEASAIDLNESQSKQYLEMLSEAQVRISELEAELDRAKGKLTVEDVRAQMMEPYARKVFRFVGWYCAAVGVFLLLNGFRTVTNFSLSDTVLGIIAGSTAVSVIGLIGLVISGLFPKSPKSDRKP